ncbi:MAG: hypothetical protein KatS3mg124_1148 [Porticoccaceae bacterium]|nr:MAG: hypothetical protein KatS3mg124_1148 [Porticoccaceae bacterium]
MTKVSPLDAKSAAVGRFQGEGDVVPRRPQGVEPGNLHRPRRHEAAALPHESLVVAGCAVGLGGIGVVAKGAAVGKERRLPAVAAEAREAPHPLAADTQPAPREFEGLPGQHQTAPGDEELFVAWAQEGAVARRRSGPRLGEQGSRDPRRSLHQKLEGVGDRHRGARWRAFTAGEGRGVGGHERRLAHQGPAAKGFDAGEAHRRRAPHGGTPTGIASGQGRGGGAQLEDPPVGEGQIDPHLVGVPGLCQGLHAKAHAEARVVRCQPGVDRIAHPLLGGALRQHPFPLWRQIAGEIHRRSPFLLG